MNRRDAFALSNNPSRTAFQPIEANQFEPKRRTPTTITFKSSKAILSAETNQIEELLLDASPHDSTLRDHSSFDHLQDPDEEELYRSVSLANEFRSEEPASSGSEPLPFQDGTSRSNSSGQSLFSDEASCLVFSPRADPLNSSQPGRVDSKQSSIDSSSLYSTLHSNETVPKLNKHLLISDRHSPQLLFGSQLPAGVCCVLSSKPTSGLNELIAIQEDPPPPSFETAAGRQDNLELLDIPKRTKRKHKSRSQSSLYQQLDPAGAAGGRLISMSNPNSNLAGNLVGNLNSNLSNLTSQQLASLMAGEQNAMQAEAKPQFRFTRYDTVEEDGNHVKLLAIDHLPAQMLFQDSGDIANLNQARLIQTNLLKQKFSKNKTSQQPDTNNSHQQIAAISQLPNLANNSFAIIAKNKFGVLGGGGAGQSKCSCNEQNNSREINNNRPDVCLECESTKKILQSNFVQLVPLNSRPSGSTSNSNTSPLSIQISPLSAASSAHSTCSGQPASTVSSASLQSGLPIGIALTNAAQPQCHPMAAANTAGNVFNYDAATIHQYAISLSDPLNQQAKLIKLGQHLQQQQNENNLANAFSNPMIDDQLANSLRLQERAASSLSGISSDPLSGQPPMAGNLPVVRSASSCAQYNVLPNSMQDYQATANQTNLPNQFQPIAPANHSRSEQNLMSSNRFYNGNQSFVPNQPTLASQPQFYSQQAIYSGSPTVQLGQSANGQPGHFNRPLRLSFRTPSPTMLTTSSLADSNLESPSQTYVDNNDSVNIFNKYQTSSSSNYYYRTGPKEHDFFRKGNCCSIFSFRFSLISLNGPNDHQLPSRLLAAVPTLPIILAILLCILNWFLPGSGK